MRSRKRSARFQWKKGNEKVWEGGEEQGVLPLSFHSLELGAAGFL